jgi:hypothetical protein
MPPVNPQNSPSVPTSLPPVAADQQQFKPAPAPTSPAGPSLSVSEHYAVQAKQALVQYAGDPYRLSEALSQLKAAYLSEQYHITANKAGS